MTPDQKAAADRHAAEAAARKQAQATGKPVPVDADTTETTTVSANPDGSFSADERMNPVRVKKNGAWTPIDPTLVADPDGILRPKAAKLGIAFSGGGTAPLAVIDDGSGHVLTITWPGPLPKPTVSGASALYADVLPGVDLQMTAEGTAYSDVLIVHDAAAAANPALRTIHLGMTGPGLAVGTNPNGGLNVADPSGKTVFTGPTPSLWDSYQSPSVRLRKTTADADAPGASPGTEQPAPPGHKAAMPARAAQGGIDISPDTTVLTGKGTVYPVFVDPVGGLPPEYWAEVWSCPAWAGDTFIGADGSYSISYPGGGTNTDVVRAGYYPAGGACPGPVRPMLEWDIREFAAEGATINTAEVWLWQQYGPCTLTDLWAAGPIDGYPSPTWNNIAAGSPGFNTGHFVSQGNCVGGSPDKVVFGDTGQLQSLVSGGSAAHPSMTVGFRTHDESSGNFEAFFVQNNGAYNPVLHVDYNLPPSIDNLWMDNTNGYLPKLPGTSPTYAVHAHVTDADAHPLTVHFNANVSDGNTLPGDVQASADANGNATGYIPASWLHDGYTYRLSATVVDNSSNLQATYPDGSRPTYTAAFSPPSQPVIASGTDSTGAAYFPASSTGKPGIKGAGVNVANAFHLTTTLTGPTSPRIDYYDYVINGDASTAGPNSCANPTQCGRLSTTINDAWINLNSAITHAGINYVYVKAVDLAANTSWYGEYDFFVPAAFVPTTWGDVTGDAVPDIVATAPADPSAPLGPQRLVAFPTNVDPAKTSSTGFGGNWIETSSAAAAPDNTSWAGTLLTHRGSTRGKPYDDLFAWKNGQLYSYLSTLGSTSNPGNNPVDAFARSQRAPVGPLPCQKCGANYTGDWSTVKQILALGPVTGGLPSAKTSLIVAEDDGVGGANLWLFTTTTGGQLNPTMPPRLIASCSTPIPGQAPCPAGWNWAKTTLIAPGNADAHPAGIDGKATSGLPDLWVRDNTTGTLYMFPNRLTNGVEDPTALGDFRTRVQLGTAGQFKTDQFPALFTNGNSDVGGTGKPDLWGLTPNGQLTLIVDPADSTTNAIPATSFETVSSAGWTGSYNLSSADTASLTPAIGALAAAPNGTPVCTDLAGGSTANGAKVQVWTCNGNIDQAWTFGGDGTIRWAGAKNAGGTYTKCLEIANSSLAPGTPIQSSDCTGAANQKWRLRRDSSGLAALFNPLSGLCIDDPNYSTANGTQFQTLQCRSGDTAQLWNMPTPGFAPLTAEAENLAVTAAGGGTAGPQTNCCGVTWSGGSQLVLSPSAQNASMTMSWYVPYAGAYRVAPIMTQAVDYGQVQVTVDKGVSGQEQKLPQVFDGYHNGVTTTPFTFGTANFAAPGMHTITFTVTGTNPASTGNRYLAGVDLLQLVPVTGLGPIPALTIAPTAFTNFPITADASGTAAGSAAVASYTFSFDDGSAPVTGPTPTVSHTFTTTGTWVLTVKATDANGVSASTSRAIVVSGTASLTSADGTTTASCATTGSAASTMASLTPTLGASVTAGQTAQFELRDLTDPSAAPPIAIGSAGSTGSAGPVSTVSTPTLVNGHEYAFAARSSDGSGDVSAISPSCSFWAITSGGQATPTGAVGLPFDNTSYPAADTQTWAGPATTLTWSGGTLSLTRNIDSAVLWTSGTWGASNVLILQNDGNVVVYGAQPTISATGAVSGTALWKTSTSAKGATNLLLAANGSLTVRAGTTVLWTPQTSPRGPSLPNGDFESGTLSGWSAAYNAGVTTTYPHTGTYAGQINAPAGGNGSIEQVVTGLAPNTSYTLTGWVRTDGGSTMLGAKQYDATDDSQDDTTTATNWALLTEQFTTGPTGTSVDIYCYRNTAGTSACDDITLMATPATATVANPDFETGNVAGWTDSYHGAITTTNPHTGAYAGQITAATGTPAAIEQVVTGLIPNTAYTLTGWVRTDGGATLLGAKEYDTAGNVEDATTTATGWTQLTNQFTTGATGTSVDIYCYRATAGTSACDDIFLTPTPATVANPDLESGTLAGWAASYGATITTTNPHSGTHAGQLNATTDDNASLEQVVTGLTPNTAYTLTGWVRTDGATTILGAKQYDTAGDNEDATTTNTGWTQLSDQFTTDATGTSVDIYCYRYTAGTSACDDIGLTKS